MAALNRTNSRHRRALATSGLMLAVLMTLSGCAASLWPTDADFNICPNGEEKVASVRLSQTANVAMRVDEALQVSAELLDAQSSPMYLCLPSIVWSSDNPAVATVDAGRVRAVGTGQSVITASAGGKSASFTVVVSNTALRSLTLSQDTATLLVGQTLRFTATGRDSSGATVSSQLIAWSTSDSSIATLSGPNTILIAHRLGTVQVYATVGTVVASARVDIVSGSPAVTVRDITTGWMHSCALVGGGGIPEGSAYCWGEGTSGALGTGAVQRRAVPTKVSGGLTFTSIAAGENGSCAIATSGSAYCWGDNTAGQLGDGNAGSFSTTPQMVSTTLSFRVLRMARALTCGLVATGDAYCWGSRATGLSRVPTLVAGGRQYAELSANGGDMCGRTAAGDAYCWDAQSAWTQTAATRVSSPVAFTLISAGPYYNCGLSADGTAYCWGTVSGQLGSSIASGNYTSPTRVAVLQRFSSVTAGGNFTCGISGGMTYCLGNTSLTSDDARDPNPRLMPNDAQHPFVRLVSGAFHGCALDTKGGAWCFGRSYEGQLGAGDYMLPPGIPLQLRFPPP